MKVAVRWTVGDVSEQGFEALGLSVCGAVKLFGAGATYTVCVNTVGVDAARAATGSVPRQVVWRAVDHELPEFLRSHLAENMAEGVGWKFAPLRVSEGLELSLDNDCILWGLPPAIGRWLGDGGRCVIAEDVRACFGQFAELCGDKPRNSGIRGLAAGFDLEAAMRRMLRERPVRLTSEVDEQGLQVAMLERTDGLEVVEVEDVSICSPFPPHMSGLGRCGAHFVGLNARRLPWSLDGRNASEHIAAHWRGHRRELYERVSVGE